MNTSALSSPNVLLRGTLRLLLFVSLSFAAVFSASAGFGLLKTLVQGLNSGAAIGAAEAFTHSALTLAFFVSAGFGARFAKNCYW